MSASSTRHHRKPRKKSKALSHLGQFIAVPTALLRTEKYRNLRPHAVKLLFDLYGQYRGNNNGDFCAAWSVMQPLGWKSEATLHKALKELQQVGFIIKTRQGGKCYCSLYAVTWHAIDHCNGKLDYSPMRVALRWWKDDDGPPAAGGQEKKAKSSSPPWEDTAVSVIPHG